MTEVACNNCEGACCKGAPLLIMELSADELQFMEAGGNTLLTIAKPTDSDRANVIYPLSMQTNRERGTFNWLVDPDNMYQPLLANFGRYALVGTCRYLAPSLLGFDYCSVYDDRPGVCRNFQVGSDKCLLLRDIHGIPLPFPTTRSPGTPESK